MIEFNSWKMTISIVPVLGSGSNFISETLIVEEETTKWELTSDLVWHRKQRKLAECNYWVCVYDSESDEVWKETENPRELTKHLRVESGRIHFSEGRFLLIEGLDLPKSLISSSLPSIRRSASEFEFDVGAGKFVSLTGLDNKTSPNFEDFDRVMRTQFKEFIRAENPAQSQEDFTWLSKNKHTDFDHFFENFLCNRHQSLNSDTPENDAGESDSAVLTGRNIHIEAIFDAKPNANEDNPVRSPLFYMEQSENSDGTIQVVAVGEKHEWDEKRSDNRRQLYFEVSGQDPVHTGSFYVGTPSEYQLTISQDRDRFGKKKRCQENVQKIAPAYFEFMADSVPLSMHKPEDWKNRIAVHVFSGIKSDRRKCYIGFDPRDGENTFDGTIRRLVFDPTGHCPDC